MVGGGRADAAPRPLPMFASRRSARLVWTNEAVRVLGVATRADGDLRSLYQWWTTVPGPTVPEPTVPEPTVPEPTVPEPTVPEPTGPG